MRTNRSSSFVPGQDITGHRFGRMVVIGKSAVLAKAGYLWSCRCDCGKDFLANAGSIRRGDYQSCGCFRAEKMVKHSMVRSPEYRAWADMIDRCFNPNNPRFKDYGGRGITVCELWRHSFVVFYADLGSRPDGYQLDRIDNDGSYVPGNCHWTTPKLNARNRRTSRILECDGRSQSVIEWSEETGIPTSTIFGRMRLGWPIEEILSLPPSKGNRIIRKAINKESRPNE